MKCSYCGLEFKEEEARKGCAGCSLFGQGCGMVRCPRCGYEMPPEPGWIKRLKAWRKKGDETVRKGGRDSGDVVDQSD